MLRIVCQYNHKSEQDSYWFNSESDFVVLKMADMTDMHSAGCFRKLSREKA